MTKNEIEISEKYCAKAIDILKRTNIPSYPKFYELFYTYASGTNVKLNTLLNDKFSSGKYPNVEFVEALYNEYLSTKGAEERLSEVTDEIAAQIAKVNTTITSARTNNDNYSDMLNSAIGDLDGSVGDVDISKLTKKLLKVTKEMQVANAELEGQLADAKHDVDALKDEVNEVRKEASLDALTKIDNRKSFDQFILKAVKKAEQEGDVLSLLMMDIDHFKKFNDTWGHQTGDQVLRLVAATLSTGTRDTDLAARYGGEEFVVVLPGSDLEEASAAGEKLRTSIKNRKLHKRSTNENLGRVTISIGVATFRHGDSAETMIDRADSCLYAAKHAGRDKVINENDPLMLKNSKVA